MNMQKRFGGVWRLLRGTFSQPGPDDETGGFFAPESGYGAAGSLSRWLSGRSLELAEVQQEVAAELRGQVLVIGPHDAANRGLLARLRGQPVVPPGGPIYREGFFALATLPTEQPAGRGAGDDAGALALAEILSLVSEADALLYVFVAQRGWRAADARWYARLRATGAPLTLVEVDPPPDPLLIRAEETRAALPAGERPLEVCLTASEAAGAETPADVIALVERILAQRQRLAIPLAHEIPGCRALIAERTIRSGMLMAALLGAEPIPLVDLPLQVTLNWRMALQLAAIYGHAGLDYRSREMIGTVAWNLGLRYLIQQALKLVPVLGWVASAALSCGGAWLFGQMLQRYYQAGEANSEWRIANGRWQDIRHKGHEATAKLRARTAQWRQAAATRSAGLRGRLVRTDPKGLVDL